MTEAKKKRILKKIDKLKKAMRQEKAIWGGYHDGRGLRYSIAELYFELKDYKKTNRYLSWFNKVFSDDCKYPYFLLAEAVTRFETKKLYEAKLCTIKLNGENTYLIDLIIGNEVADQKKYEWGEYETLIWAKQYFKELLPLLTENYLNWLTEFRKDPLYVKYYDELISIKRKLIGLEISPERNNLLDAAIKCLTDWGKEMK
jgi:hypothetical protein